MDQVSRALLAVGGGASAAQTYVDDVFSTYLYSGNSAAQTINSGINLSANSGMVWVKGRNAGLFHTVFDTARGPGGGHFKALFTNSTDAQAANTTYMTSLDASGFTLGSQATTNGSGTNFASWTFRKAPKFFDVVTYTGDGTDGRNITHSLGVTPGLVLIKRTDTSSDWAVYENSTTRTGWSLNRNLSSAVSGLGLCTSTTFRVNAVTGTTGVMAFTGSLYERMNVTGGSYVAYLFAHDTAADGMIQCGSFTTDGSGNANVTTLGWEPQFLLVKAASTTGDWIMLDSMRGWNMTAADARLLANTTAAETTAAETGNPTATGFSFSGGSASATYIYMAIRRPNKPASYVADGYFSVTGSASVPTRDGSLTMRNGSAHAKDALIAFPHVLTPTSPPWLWADMLRGYAQGSEGSPTLDSSSTGSEVVRTTAPALTGSGANTTTNSAAPIIYVFRRAPGFFDVVCYTGNSSASGSGSTQTISHNLSVKPELIITKARSASTSGQWLVGTAFTASNQRLGYLHLTNALTLFSYSGNAVYAAEPTASSFSVINQNTAPFANNTNESGVTYVSYLFASVPGLSKVGTYTGNGSSQTINCGFTTGARFVLIKRTDSTGDWHVWDTSQGIVAANDPHLSLNTGVARVSTDDSIDPDNSGFIVNQVAATNINVSSATYIYLAIA